MSDPTLSKAITQATVFLEQVHADVQTLLAELIAQLERVGWRPAYGNRVSWDLSNKLDGCWVQSGAYIYFLPKKNVEARKANRLIAVTCTFGAPEGASHGYATFAASFVRFPQPVHMDDDDPWADDYGPAAYQACLGQSGPVKLERHQFDVAFPKAEAVSAVILPLCELTGVDALHARVVAPLLALAAKA